MLIKNASLLSPPLSPSSFQSPQSSKGDSMSAQSDTSSQLFDVLFDETGIREVSPSGSKDAAGSRVPDQNPRESRSPKHKEEQQKESRQEEPGQEIDAQGAALIPALYDHHIHLLALLESFKSLDCQFIKSEEQFRLELKKRAADEREGGANTAGGESGVRAIRYHESLAGALDRKKLDEIVADRPVRIQHRSGALWVLNTKALAELGLDSKNGDSKNGCLYRSDHLLRQNGTEQTEAEQTFTPDFSLVAKKLNEFGVVGATDATPGYKKAEVEIFKNARASSTNGSSNNTSLEIQLMAEEFSPEDADWMGPRKIILDDFAPMEFDDLLAVVLSSRDSPPSPREKKRPVAIHCVSRASLAVVLAVFREAGAIEGDRIEHASVAPPEMVDAIARLGVRIVTQPNFIYERGDQYLKDVPAEDIDYLYRCQGWLDAGVPLAGGTDAPFGDPNPWLAIWAAMNRKTQSGKTIGAAEALNFESALELFLPSKIRHKIKIGEKANLCLLAAPIEGSAGIAATQPENPVAAAFFNGRQIT